MRILPVGRSAPLLRTAAGFLLICAYAYSLGIPVLRHDWPAPDDTFIGALGALSGWSVTGIGNPSGYPSSFAIAALQAIAQHSIGAEWTTHILLAAMIGIIVAGAGRLARVMHTTTLVHASIVIFALTNPWTYNQLVAGHYFMLIAYGASFAVIAEFFEVRPSRLRLVALSLALSVQIQFYIVAFLFYFYFAIRRRAYTPLVAHLAFSLPVLTGIFFNHKSLTGILYSLDWERVQSLAFPPMVLLNGYFAHYADAPGPFFISGMLILVPCAIAGFVLAMRNRDTRWTALVFVPVAWALGVNGPLRELFEAIVINRPESAIFRELYDLLAYLVIVYSIWMTMLARKFRVMQFVLPVGAVCLVAGWIVAPPSTYWVDYRGLSTSPECAQPQTRLALFPAFQPLSLLDEHAVRRGSGLDPEAHSYAGDISAINSMTPAFPEVSALQRFAETGATDALQALSVSCIVERSRLITDTATLQRQLGLTTSNIGNRGSHPILPQKLATGQLLRVTPLPEMTIGQLPIVAAVIRRPGGGNIFYADAAAGDPTFQIYHARGDVRSADQGWIDVRLAFAQRAKLGQAFGGVMTTGSGIFYPVTGGDAALIFVDGRLIDDHGRVFARHAPDYQWTRIPADAHGVRCDGLCVLAAHASRLPGFPGDPPPRAYTSVQFRAVVPWLVFTDVPAGNASLLRYNVRFDENWKMIGAWPGTRHVRIDTIVNGWILPERRQSRRVWMIERAACATAASELLALLACIVCMYRARRVDRARAE